MSVKKTGLRCAFMAFPKGPPGAGNVARCTLVVRCDGPAEAEGTGYKVARMSLILLAPATPTRVCMSLYRKHKYRAPHPRGSADKRHKAGDWHDACGTEQKTDVASADQKSQKPRNRKALSLSLQIRNDRSRLCRITSADLTFWRILASWWRRMAPSSPRRAASAGR